MNILKDADISEILKKGSAFMLLRGGGMLAGYLFTYFIAQKYGASVNGLVALSFSMLMFVSIFGRLGIDINLVKFYANPVYWEEEPGIFYRSLLKSFLAASLLSALLYVLKDFFVFTVFKKPQLVPYIFWVCLTIPCWVVIRICAGLLRAKRLINWFAFLDSPGRFGFSLLFLLGLWILFDDPLNAIKAHFFALLALALLALILAIKSLKHFSFKTSHNSWSFLREGLPMMWSGAMIVFLGWSDIFILGIFETDETVGIYHVALKIAALTGFTLEAINSVLMPQMAKYYQEKNSLQYKKLIRFATYLNFTITAVVVLLIIFFNEWILGVFGEEFIVGGTVLVVLLVGQLFSSIAGPTGMILQMTGHQKTYRNIVTGALVLNITLSIILTMSYGYTGTAVATAISLALWKIGSAVYIKQKLDIETFFNPFFLLKNS